MRLNKISCLVAAAMISACAAAMPSYPGLLSFTQPDGTVISIVKKGDEHFHMTFTSDGYPLVFNNESHAYEYALVSNGTLKSSGIEAVEPSERSVEAKNYLSKIDKENALRFFHESSKSLAINRRLPESKIVRSSNVPTIGRHKVLIVLAQFSDTKFSENVSSVKSYYDDFFNGEDFNKNGATGSAYKYFYDCSSKQ